MLINPLVCLVATQNPTLQPLDLANASLTTQHATAVRSGSGLRLTFEQGKPGVATLKFPSPLDIGGVVVRFRKVSGQDGWFTFFCGRTGQESVEAGAWVSGSHNWLVRAGRGQSMLKGMGAAPPLEGVSAIGGGMARQDSVDSVGFRVPYPAEPVVLEITSLSTLPVTEWKGIIDRYGQYTKATWPGKATNDADLVREREEEAAFLSKNAALPGFDRYGGWAEGPTLKATGRFRTEKVNGKWWLVTPDGHLFFSTGMNNIQPGDDTIVDRREELFQWLPGLSGDPLSPFYKRTGIVVSGPVWDGRTFDFAEANLFRKYGQGHLKAFWDVTTRRLRSWGFNTLANWTADEYNQMRRVPYVATTAIWGGSRLLRGAPDPWSPAFQEALDADLKRLEYAKNDPWCLGIFVDNEINWGAGEGGPGRAFYLLATMDAPATVPARVELNGWLRAKYADVGALNKAWGSSFPSMEDVLQKQHNLDALATVPGMQADAREWGLKVYRQYFKRVRQTLDAKMPGTLYLGPRLHAWPPEAAAAASEFCDVVSYNFYRPTVPSDLAKQFTVDKPIIVGEWSVRGTYSGMFNRMPGDANSPAERKTLWQTFFRSGLENPNVVGLHWFRYRDQATAGRPLDGENSAFGFVSVTDRPYPELVSVARAEHGQMYRSRHR